MPWDGGSVDGGRRMDCWAPVVGVAERPITTSSSSSLERTLLGREFSLSGCGAASAVAMARGGSLVLRLGS